MAFLKCNRAEIVVLGLTFLTLALRLVGGLSAPLHGDELFTRAASASLAGTASDHSHPPGYYSLLLAAGLGGSDAPWLRLPSVVASVLLIPIAFLLVRRLLGERVALLTALLLILSYLQGFWAIHARPYAVYALVATFSTYALIRANESKRWLLAWALSAAGGLVVHYFMAFMLLAHLPLARRLWGPAWWLYMARGGAVAAPMALPWLLVGLPGQMGASHGETAALAAQGYTWPPVHDTLLRAFSMFGSPLAGVGLAFAAISLLGFAFLFSSGRNSPLKPPGAGLGWKESGRFLTLWLLLPLAAGTAFSYFFLKPVEMERMLFPLQVPFLAGVAAFGEGSGRWGRVAVVGLALVGLLGVPSLEETGDFGVAFTHGRLPFG